MDATYAQRQRREISERLGSYLRKLRDGREKNAFYLSLGLNPAKLGRLENSAECPSLLRLIQLCEKTGVSANWVLCGVGPQTMTPADSDGDGGSSAKKDNDDMLMSE